MTVKAVHEPAFVHARPPDTDGTFPLLWRCLWLSGLSETSTTALTPLLVMGLAIRKHQAEVAQGNSLQVLVSRDQKQHRLRH